MFILTIVLCILLLGGCPADAGSSTQSKATATAVEYVQTEFPAREGDLTLSAIQGASSVEELAAIIGVGSASQIDQILAYIRNYSLILPSLADTDGTATGWSRTDEGHNSLTIAQAKTLITPVVVTAENWKDYIVTYMDSETWIFCDEDGNQTTEEVVEPQIGFDSEKYHFCWGDLSLVLRNNVTGEVVEYEGSDWPEYVDLVDGVWYTLSYDDDWNETRTKFDLDNYTCILADCIVYEYDLDPQLVYVEYYDYDKCDWIVIQADEYTGGEETPIVFVQYGETDGDICRVGYDGLGDYVYTYF